MASTRGIVTGGLITGAVGLMVILAVGGQPAPGLDGEQGVRPAAEQPRRGGSDDRPRAESGLPIEKVQIAGREFKLELAATPETRLKGLSHREKIAPDGGMLFAFPNEGVGVQQFVMRHCPVDIDIIYLDPYGKITATYAMKSEPPQRENESDWEYERRLRKYSSRFAAQFAIELAGGTLEALRESEEGQRALARGAEIRLDRRRLREEAK